MRFFPTVIASVLGTLIALGFAFFFFLIILAGLISTRPSAPSIRQGSVLVVDLSGVVPERKPESPFVAVFEGRIPSTLHEITGAIRRAADDERIASVWLRPSGLFNGWASLEEIGAAIDEFRKSGKPVVASSGATGYSERDYFVAIGADHVFSSRAARFEMNGFVLVLQFMSQLLEKLDIDVLAVRAGNFKSAVEPFTRDEPSEENREQIVQFIDAHSELFVEAVARDRAIDPAMIRRLIDTAEIRNAEQALEYGLIDSLLVGDDVEKFIAALIGASGDLAKVSVDDYIVATRPNAGAEGVVAVVNAAGTILPGRSTRDSNPLFGETNVGSDSMVELLRRLRDDESVDAVVLRITSPGGSAEASDVIWHSIKETARKKPVVASLGDVAASGGYYIASAADSIVSSRTTLTGSIGVFSLLLDVSGLLEDKIGLTHEAIKSAQHADMFTGLRSLSSLETSMLESDVDRTYSRFKGIVEAERGLSEVEVEEVSRGRVWSGADAQRLGLVDRLGGLHEAIQIAAGMAGLDDGRYRTRLYPRPRGILQQLDRFMEVEVAGMWWSADRDGPAGAFHRQIELLETAADLHATPQAMLPMSISLE
jgi:protease-4